MVALGGGHGLAVTLSAVSRYAGQVTAVVSAADDGGSSGRLRAWWDGPAPGDVRRCLLALAGNGQREKLWAEALDHRFPSGELAGHSLGNLVLVGLSQVTGDFVTATTEVARLLGVNARILPATSEAVELCAEVGTAGGATAEMEGQAKLTRTPAPIRRVWLRPAAPAAPAEALDAIAGADQVVLGPGSLFTSILAVCAVPGIRRALAERAGGRVYVCNLQPQDPETAGYDAGAHIDALWAHDVLVDAVVCDPSTAVGSPLPARAWEQAGEQGREKAGERGVQVVGAAVAGPGGHSHDPALLASVLAGLAGVQGPGEVTKVPNPR